MEKGYDMAKLKHRLQCVGLSKEETIHELRGKNGKHL